MRLILLILLAALASLPSASAAYLFNGTSQYLTGTPPTLAGTDHTLSIRGITSAIDSVRCAVAIRSTSAANPIPLMFFFETSVARFIVRDDAGNTAESTLSGAYTPGTWGHFGGVRSGNDVLVYVNGTAGIGATATLGTITTNVIDVGTVAPFGNTNRTAYWPGGLADLAIWEAALTEHEMAALAKGASPLLIRPAALVYYAPLVRATTEPVGRLDLTLIASPGVSAHPRIYR